MLDRLGQYCFENPLAPFAAAEIEGRTISIDEIKKAYYTLYRSYEAIVVEGIGGLMVPVKKDYYVVDLAKEFSLSASDRHQPRAWDDKPYHAYGQLRP